MAYSPQDVYARHLVSGRGYPLWTPEPNMNLPDVYIREGLRIGDVGVVVPEDGSFDVFFNICLSDDHTLHRETGVPENFKPVQLSARDIAVFPEAECAGRIISKSFVARVRSTDAPDDHPERGAQPGPMEYEFTLVSKEGAVLILPEGAERYYLRNECLFRDEAMRHAIDWYTFATQRLGRIISHDALYLITGFHKARSWSLAAYQWPQGASITGPDSQPVSAQFKAAQIGHGNVAASYRWETTQAMDWRVGPSDQYCYGIPNQTLFIQGFKVAIREGLLGKKRIKVNADIPSVRPHRLGFYNGSWFSNLLTGTSGSSSGAGSTTSVLRDVDPTRRFAMSVDSKSQSFLANDAEDLCDNITVQRFPQVSKPFHPSDIINGHLLRSTSATVAVTHDNDWGTLGTAHLKLNIETPSEEEHFIQAVLSDCQIMLSLEGAAYLKRGDFKSNSAIPAIPLVGLPQVGMPGVDHAPQDTSMKQPGSGRGGSELSKRLSNQRTIHVAVVGMVGVGKSTLVNVLKGMEIAEVNSNVRPCITRPTRYEMVEGDTRYCIWDTKGLNEGVEQETLSNRLLRRAKIIPDADIELKKFLRGSHPRVDLVLFCIDAKKIRAKVHWEAYNKIWANFGKKRLKVALVVTQLGEGDSKSSPWKGTCRAAAREVVEEFPDATLMEFVPKFEELDEMQVRACKSRIFGLISSAYRMPCPRGRDHGPARMFTFEIGDPGRDSEMSGSTLKG